MCIRIQWLWPFLPDTKSVERRLALCGTSRRLTFHARRGRSRDVVTAITSWSLTVRFYSSSIGRIGRIGRIKIDFIGPSCYPTFIRPVGRGRIGRIDVDLTGLHSFMIPAVDVDQLVGLPVGDVGPPVGGLVDLPRERRAAFGQGREFVGRRLLCHQIAPRIVVAERDLLIGDEPPDVVD
jgi:hypothetical protein